MVRDLYPFKDNYFVLKNKFKCHYIDEGSGEPIVMLHGNPTWSFYYRNLVRALKGFYRTIVPDHIGCGLSDKPNKDSYPYTLEQRVDDLEQLLNHLKIQSDITLVIHDWGGMIGMTYAARHIDKIKRIIVLNTGAFHLPKHKRFPLRLRICRNKPIGALLVRGLNMFCRSAVNICAKRPLPDNVRQAYLSPYDSWENRVAVHNFIMDIPLHPGDREYDLVTKVQEDICQLNKIPMLICWGEKDFVFDHHFLNEWIRRFPLVEVHRFPEAGHFVLEDAYEKIEPLVFEFLESHPINSSAIHKSNNSHWLGQK